MFNTMRVSASFINLIVIKIYAIPIQIASFDRTCVLQILFNPPPVKKAKGDLPHRQIPSRHILCAMQKCRMLFSEAQDAAHFPQRGRRAFPCLFSTGFGYPVEQVHVF